MNEDAEQRLKEWASGKAPKRGAPRSRDKKDEPGAVGEQARLPPASIARQPGTASGRTPVDHELRRQFEEAGELSDEERVHRPGPRPPQVRISPTAPAPPALETPTVPKRSQPDAKVKTPQFPADWFDIPARCEEAPIGRRPAWERLLEHPDSGEGVFNIGIDVGTSGIRVASFDEDTDRIRAFDFGPNEGGGTRFSFPAVVGRRGSYLTFGNDACRLPPTERVVSYKAGLIHPDHESRYRVPWAEIGAGSRALFQGDGGPGPEAFAFVLSLAQALQIAVPQLLLAPGVDPPPAYVRVSVGAPGRRGSDWHRRIERATFAALRIAGGLPQQPKVEEAVSWFVHAWRRAEAESSASEEEKRVFLVPEVYASLRALSSGFVEGENLLIADIGATTTEIAVLRYHQRKIHLWHGDSTPVGVDDRDRGEEAGNDVLQIRRKRPSRSASASWEGYQGTSRSLGSLARRTVCSAVQLNMDEPSWKAVSVVVVGGGSHIPPLKAAVRSPPGNEGLHRWVKQVSLREPTAGEVEVVGRSADPPGRDELPEIIPLLGIVREDWGSVGFSDETLERVDVGVEDPEEELKKEQLKGKSWV